MADTTPITWTELYERVSKLEAELTQRAVDSRDTAARLERELSRATKREAELTKQLQTVALKLRRTERLLIKPGYFVFHFTTARWRHGFVVPRVGLDQCNLQLSLACILVLFYSDFSPYFVYSLQAIGIGVN